MASVDWKAKAAEAQAQGRPEDVAYRQANADIIARAVDGLGTISGVTRDREGVRAVFNASSSHLPDILRDGYHNCYATSGRRVIGDPSRVSRRRWAVDSAIAGALPEPAEIEKLHYGAVELNGLGMRYYGDVCIVLKREELDVNVDVLFRNSYDLARPPMLGTFISGGAAASNLARSIMGKRSDLGYMLSCKMMGDPSVGQRLLTVGRISQALLHDEDYFEVVRIGNFNVSHIEEIRLSPGDAALELQIADQLDRGLSPSLPELIWMFRRDEARRAAADHNISVRIVVSDGRLRG